MRERCGVRGDSALGTFKRNSEAADAIRRELQVGKLSGAIKRVAARLAHSEAEVDRCADWIYDQVEGNTALPVSVLAEFMSNPGDLGPVARRRVLEILTADAGTCSGASLVGVVGSISAKFGKVQERLGQALEDGIVEPSERTAVMHELRGLRALVDAQIERLDS